MENQLKRIKIPIQLLANPFLCAIKSVVKLMCRNLTLCVQKRCGDAMFVCWLRTYHVLLSGKYNASTKSPDTKIMTEYFCMYDALYIIIARAYTFSHSNTVIQAYNANILTVLALEWDKQQGIQ